jgi:hypothetical protein
MAQKQRVEVTRAFQRNNEPVGPGSVIDLDMDVAREMASNNKVKFVHQQTPLKMVTELPDPNVKYLERQSARQKAVAGNLDHQIAERVEREVSRRLATADRDQRDARTRAEEEERQRASTGKGPDHSTKGGK